MLPHPTNTLNAIDVLESLTLIKLTLITQVDVKKICIGRSNSRERFREHGTVTLYCTLTIATAKSDQDPSKLCHILKTMFVGMPSF